MRVVDTWHRKDKTRTTRYGTGKRWQAVYTDGYGREQKRSFDTKPAAWGWLKEHDGSTQDPVTVAAYAERWVARQVHQRDSSREMVSHRVQKQIIGQLGDKLVHTVTRADVQDAVLAWQVDDRLAPSTIKVAYAYLAGMFRDAVLDELIDKSPCVRIRLPKVEGEQVRPLTVEQVQQIADRLWRPYRAAAVVAAATGMRPGEWRGLTVDRVDLDEGLITVDRQHRHGKLEPVFGPPKTDWSYRKIRVGAETLSVLKDLAKDPGPAGLLFHSSGRAMDRGMVGEAWSDVREKLPWAGAGWHQLRHHHASVLLSAGASVVAVARRLGHKDGTETLKTYGHLMPHDDARMVALTDGHVRLDRHRTATEPPPVA